MLKHQFYFRLAMKYIMRRRKNVLNIFVLSLSIIVMVLTISASNTVNEFMYDKLQTSVDFRTILINTNHMDKMAMEEKLQKIKHIVKIYPYISNNGALVKGLGGEDDPHSRLNGEVFLKPYISNVSPKVLEGEEMLENDHHVGLIPQYFAPQKGIDISLTNSGLHYLYGEDLIGETLVLQYKEFTETGIQYKNYELLVGGVYDATISMDSPNTIYLPYSEMLLLNESFQKIEDVQVYAVIVDQYNHISDVMRDLQKIGYHPELKSQIQGGIPQFLIHIGFLLFFFISTISLVIITINSLNSLKERAREIAMMKAIGYNDSDILKLFVIETFIVCLISILLSVIVAAIMMFGANLYIDHYFNLYFNDMKFSFINYLRGGMFSFILGGMFLVMIGVVVYSRIIAIHPKLLLRN